MSQRTKRIIFYISTALIIALIVFIISSAMKINKKADENPTQATVAIPNVGNANYTKISTKSWANNAWLRNVKAEEIVKINFISRHADNETATQAWVFDGVGCYYNDGTVNLIVGQGLKITGSMNSAFANMKKLTTVSGLDLVDTSEVTDMSNLFNGCENLQDINLNELETDNVILANWMLKDCINLQNIDMSKVNLENAIEMQGLFSGCIRATNISIPKMRDVVSLSYMFENVGRSTPIDDFSICGNLNTQNCTDMSYMFSGSRFNDYSFVQNFNTTNLQNAEGMFFDCAAYDLDLSQWDVSKLKNAKKMFADSTFMRTCNTNNWNVQSLKTCEEMFYNCTSLDEIALNWVNVPNIQDASELFGACYSLQLVDISLFNEISIGDANGMFFNCYHLTTIICDKLTADVSDDMFKGCYELIGEVPYDETKVDISMANQNGYFSQTNR
jgi:hypothetical protein